MDMPITNISDLQSEIIRLEKHKQEQEIELKKRFSSPSAIFSSVMTLFPKSPDGGSSASRLFHTDIISLLSRFLIPLTLNKTLFKGSNFLVKTLVGLVSQKASDFVNEDTVSSVWDKAKGLLGKIKFGKKRKHDEPEETADFATSPVATPGSGI